MANAAQPGKKRIAYRKGYKYQLANDYYEHIPVQPRQEIKTEFIHLSVDGFLWIKKGYAWDGATSAPDTKSIIRGSLVHDALYQLMRLNLLDRKYKALTDKLLRKHCREDGMPGFLATTVYKAVKWFGKSATLAKNIKPLLWAPTQNNLSEP